MDPLVAAFARRYRFLVEADKKTVVAGWGQAHLTVERLIEILDAGGGVRLLSAVDALASRGRMRQPVPLARAARRRLASACGSDVSIGRRPKR
jgi:hypothetical protein